jgi:hypothetical protein
MKNTHGTQAKTGIDIFDTRRAVALIDFGLREGGEGFGRSATRPYRRVG